MARDIDPGDKLRTRDGHEMVTDVETGHASRHVDNLTVRNMHTYYVVAGQTSILVHNAGCMSLEDAIATKHRQERLAGRHFDNVDIALAKASPLEYEQRDGAIAHVSQLGDRYNLIVVGEEGIVMAIKGLTRRELTNLARNYGWQGYP